MFETRDELHLHTLSLNIQVCTSTDKASTVKIFQTYLENVHSEVERYK